MRSATNEPVSLSFIKVQYDPYDSLCLSNNFGECEIICRQNNGLLTGTADEPMCAKFMVT